MKIKERMKKPGSVCERDMKVIVYSNDNYRGGHFFGAEKGVPAVTPFGAIERARLEPFIKNQKSKSKTARHSNILACPPNPPVGGGGWANTRMFKKLMDSILIITADVVNPPAGWRV